MDKINFLAKDSFPASIETFDRMQKATNMAASLALLGGSNYILSGCEEKEGQIEPGIIVIAGEILPFVGGAPLEFITIQVTKHELEAFDELYPEAYIDRTVIFSAEGKLKWADIKRIVTNQELNVKLESLKSEAPGFVKKWSGLVERLDEEFMLCDGRQLLTKDYPELAWYYGKENSESFSIPDLRKRFIVGLDTGHKEYKEIGMTGGSETVTAGIEHMPPHDHVYSDDINARNGFPNIESGFPRLYDAVTSNTSARSEGTGAAFFTTKTGGLENGSVKPLENRPPFYVLAYVVRVKY